MTTSDQLQGLIVAAITGATLAGANVFNPRDWPVRLGDMPIILVQSPLERKESLGRNAPLFNVTATIRVEARATAPAATGDAGAGTVLATLGTIQRQIEVAVINNHDLMIDEKGAARIQQIAFVDIKNGVTSNAEQHVGELTMDFGLEFVQGPDDFAPIASAALTDVQVTVRDYPPAGIDIALPGPPQPAAAGSLVYTDGENTVLVGS